MSVSFLAKSSPESRTNPSSVLLIGTILLSALSSQQVSAQLPPLLEARGKSQECQSFEVWRGKAEELGGAGVTGGRVQSQNFVKRIAPAFAASSFEPFIGKPYGELTGREKKKILNVVQRCLVDAGTPSFLPLAFDDSKRSNNSTRRDLLVAIEKVQEADVQQAQQAANTRQAKAQRYAKNRPQRVARVIPGDPKAVKRQRLTRRHCHKEPSGFWFLYNDYVLQRDSTIKTTNHPNFVGYQPCGKQVVMQRFIPNATSLILSGGGQLSNTTLLSIGDICGPDSEILFLSDHLREELPKYGEVPPGAARQGSGYLTSMPYEFYVPTGSDGVVHKGITNSVEQGLLATRQIVREQCNPVPIRIRVVGGTLRKDIGRGRFNRFATVPENLQYWQYYSGIFNPNEPGKRLVHDDSRLAATYDQFAAARRRSVAASAEVERKKDEAFIVLGFLVLASMAVLEMIDPCNDSDIDYQLKHDAGCFDP